MISVDTQTDESGHQVYRHFNMAALCDVFFSHSPNPSSVFSLSCVSDISDLEVLRTLSSPLLPHSSLWICLEFPVDRVSCEPSFSPSLVNVASILLLRGWRECLSPGHSGMKALGGIVSTLRTRGSLLYLSWTLPPGHGHLLFSAFKVCNVIHSLQENAAGRLKALRSLKMLRQTQIAVIYSFCVYICIEWPFIVHLDFIGATT